MSKIGRQPINIPQEVKVKLEDSTVTIEGPRGKLSFLLSPSIEVKYDNSQIVVSCLSAAKFARAIFGTTRAIINNMVRGVTYGFKKELQIIGVGYKAQYKDKELVLHMGFSHPTVIKITEGIKVSTPSLTQVIIEGIDKAKVGQFAAIVRKVYPAEPYKGKGIRYLGEVVRKKLGKALAK